MGKSAAKEGGVCTDNGLRVGEDCSVDVDVCVNLGEVPGRFAQEKFSVAEEGIVGFVPFSFDWRDQCEDTESGFVLCILE